MGHFNPERKTLQIRQSCDGCGNISTPKNESSEDTVDIPITLTKKLLKFKEDFMATDDDWMFFATRRTGRTTIRRMMMKHIELANIPYLNIHGLRHSCASRMINMGISPLIVSKHLRHSSIKETLDTYSHLFPNETVDIMDTVFDD